MITEQTSISVSNSQCRFLKCLSKPMDKKQLAGQGVLNGIRASREAEHHWIMISRSDPPRPHV